MRIGVPRERKVGEYRVALTPDGAKRLTAEGHAVFVEKWAGTGSGFEDEEYRRAGAQMLDRAEDIFGEAELVVKVKEPEPEEYALLRPGLILFTFLHLAAAPSLAAVLQRSGVTAIGYETVRGQSGGLPLLEPMSRVAGRLAPQIGAHFLEKPSGGRGVLLGAVAGTARGRVVVLGAGVVGSEAVLVSVGMGARVSVLDISAARLNRLEERFGSRIETLFSTPETVAEAVREADLVIGAVLQAGRRAPQVVSEEMVRTMPPGSVVVDVAVDQGGSVATIDRVTTHAEPVYERFGVLHYAVANIPGAVPRSSTIALTNVTLPYLSRLAGLGPEEAFRQDPGFAEGLNVRNGEIVNRAVAESLGGVSSL